jgi:hypothetical protein
MKHNLEDGTERENHTLKKMISKIEKVKNKLYISRQHNNTIFLVKPNTPPPPSAKPANPQQEVGDLLFSLCMQVLKGAASRWCSVGCCIPFLVLLRAMAPCLMSAVFELYDPAGKKKVHVGGGQFEAYVWEQEDVINHVVDMMRVLHLGIASNSVLRMALKNHGAGSKYRFRDMMQRFNTRLEESYSGADNLQALIEYVVARLGGGVGGARKESIGKGVFGVKVQLLSTLMAFQMQMQVSDGVWLERVVDRLADRGSWTDDDLSTFISDIASAPFHQRDARQLGIKLFAGYWAKELQRAEDVQAALTTMYRSGWNIVNAARRHTADVRVRGLGSLIAGLK